jgi:hypothetical protein
LNPGSTQNKLTGVLFSRPLKQNLCKVMFISHYLVFKGQKENKKWMIKKSFRAADSLKLYLSIILESIITITL